MIFVQPEQGTAQQEAAHLISSVVKDVTRPIRVKSFTGVGVLVKMSAIEVSEPVLIGGEMRRHPVQDDADTMLVQDIHQIHEVLRCAIAACGSEVTGCLITPGAVKGVLHDGQELNMREPQLTDILSQPGGQLTIGEEAVSLFGHPLPGTEVHLIDRDGLVLSIMSAPACHPLFVAPLMTQIPDD